MKDAVFDKLMKNFSYDPVSGTVSGKRGVRVGRVMSTGYRQLGIRVGNKVEFVLEHRAIWALHTGAKPPPFIDHINGDKQDNRIGNLREATAQQNAYNRKGVKGVYQRGPRFEASCCGKYLGTFATEQEAREAYEYEAKKRFGDFTPW